MQVWQWVLVLFVGLVLAYSIMASLMATTNFFVTVTSNSMQPALERGDWALIKNEWNYKPGDVVVYFQASDLVIHRVIEVKSGSFRTKGDANSKDDGFIEGNRILGKVILTIPKVGWINLWLSGK